MQVLGSGVRDEAMMALVNLHESIIVSIEDQGSLLQDNAEEHLTEEVK